MTENPKPYSPRKLKPRSKPQPVYLNPDDIHRELHKLFPPEKIEQIAKETGLIKRRRILDPVPFLWALILDENLVLYIPPSQTGNPSSSTRENT